MLNSLKLGLLAIALLLLIVVITLLKRGRIPNKFAIVWMIPSFAILLLAIVPQLFFFFAGKLGFQTISNLVVGVLFVLLFFIIMALTVIVAGQNTKINLLIQEISMLKRKVDECEKE